LMSERVASRLTGCGMSLQRDSTMKRASSAVTLSWSGTALKDFPRSIESQHEQRAGFAGSPRNNKSAAFMP